MHLEGAHDGCVVGRELQATFARGSLVKDAEGSRRSETAQSQTELHDSLLGLVEVHYRRVTARGVDAVANAVVRQGDGLDFEAEFTNPGLVTLEFLANRTLVALVGPDLPWTLGRDGILVDLELANDLLLGEGAPVAPRALEQQHEGHEALAALLDARSDGAHRSLVTFKRVAARCDVRREAGISAQPFSDPQEAPLRGARFPSARRTSPRVRCPQWSWFDRWIYTCRRW
jgi:hypothetical protein